MKTIKQQLAALILVAGSIFSIMAMAGITTATPAVSGYDVVSYHLDSGPTRGDGSFISEYEGETYLFASKDNKATFDAEPAKYAPAYGGFCAYGVSVGKKFHVDPLAWKIQDGQLYLNLNKKVQKIWLKDVPGNIVKADKNWTDIEDVPAAKL